MNKFGIVFGVVAVATFAGCKDPNYNRGVAAPSQTEVKEVVLTPDVKPIEVKSVEVEPKTCTCAPGTIHVMPCTCGAANCACEYTPALPPETTTYIVQNGDYLSKISKKFNVKIDAIRKLNNLKSDKIRVGQKLQLPGRIDVGEQKIEKPSSNPPKTFKPYTGATKEVTVKAGDTLGALAYGNGCNIRQLKDLNNLKSEKIRVGQKLKVPAVTAKAAVEAKPTEPKKPVEALADAAPQAAIAEPAANVAAPVDPGAAEKSAEPIENAIIPQASGEAAATAPTSTYVVQEGDDVPGIAFSWGVSSAEIRELNNLGDGDVLTPGQIIKIPADARQ